LKRGNFDPEDPSRSRVNMRDFQLMDESNEVRIQNMTQDICSRNHPHQLLFTNDGKVQNSMFDLFLDDFFSRYMFFHTIRVRSHNLFRLDILKVFPSLDSFQQIKLGDNPHDFPAELDDWDPSGRTG
jgi:hypothetical protein